MPRPKSTSLLVAGVGVEIVGGAAVELAALAQLASDEKAKCYCAQTRRDPADGLDEGRLFWLFGKRGRSGGHGFFGFIVEDVGFAEGPHGFDDSAGCIVLVDAPLVGESRARG